MESKTIRIPTRELCADLRNVRDDELEDDENVCTVPNRQLRLYVAAWMLHDDVPAARDLYEGCGLAMLERPGHLTTADIVAEVLQMRAQTEDDKATMRGQLK